MDRINKRLAHGFAVALISCLIGACYPSPGHAPPDASAASEAQAQAKIKNFEQQLGSADVRSFGGGDKLPIGGPIASITISPSNDEQRFITEFGCTDEIDCYGREKFDRYIVKTYPDIARVRFHVPPDMADEEKADVDVFRQDFRRGLYFAKLIHLADGSTLFDLLTKCSKTVSPLNWAEATYDSETQKPYFPMQFFPVFRQDATGHEFEADVLLDRRGDQLTARSPMFSSTILRDPDFMTKHGLSCWRRD
jgi:hypothetical protein